MDLLYEVVARVAAGDVLSLSPGRPEPLEQPTGMQDVGRLRRIVERNRYEIGEQGKAPLEFAGG